MNTWQLRMFRWWDSLSISKKAWYGQMFPECKNSNSLIEEAYKLDLDRQHRSHLRVVK